MMRNTTTTRPTTTTIPTTTPYNNQVDDENLSVGNDIHTTSSIKFELSFDTRFDG